MALTTAIGLQKLSKKDAEILATKLQCAAKERGYRMSFGVESCTEQVRPGIRSWLEMTSADFLAVIHAPPESGPESGEISDALLGEGDAARVLEFLRTILEHCEPLVETVHFIFAVEGWEENVKFRMETGKVESFFDYLSRPGGIWLAYCHMATKTIGIEDEVPVVYSVSV